MAESQAGKGVWEVDGLNCYQTCVKLLQPDDELRYGWATAPDGMRYQHNWIRRNGQIVDPFNWTDHEDKGRRYVPGRAEDRIHEAIQVWAGTIERITDAVLDIYDASDVAEMVIGWVEKNVSRSDFRQEYFAYLGDVFIKAANKEAEGS
jgi:hypothetical protein